MFQCASSSQDTSFRRNAAIATAAQLEDPHLRTARHAQETGRPASRWLVRNPASSVHEPEAAVGGSRTSRCCYADRVQPRDLEHPDARPFTVTGYSGWIAAEVATESVHDVVTHLVDPARATETVYWGRNYLYATTIKLHDDCYLEVVVKQFRNQGLRRRVERKVRGSKATRSWRVACALQRAGIPTPRPVALIESTLPEGPSLYVSERIVGYTEVRHFFRRLAGDPNAEAFPEISASRLLSALGLLARRLHDAGIWYRDLSIGNVLVRDNGDSLEMMLVDPNRARLGRNLGVWRRSRDICRFPIVAREHREQFLAGYWGTAPGRLSPRWWLFTASVRGYLLKHQIKNRLRGKHRVARVGSHHVHIPEPDEHASVRDKAVWDHLSDQPHQHASGIEKLAIRVVDAADHIRELTIIVRSLPGLWYRHRRLMARLYRQPVHFDGFGVCLRPWPQGRSEQLAALDELKVRSVLLRLHPWEDDHREEELLASELAARGYELTFALPQSRELARNPDSWERAIERIADRFVQYGQRFQVGHAVNRSKWGIWKRSEYVELYQRAARQLRAANDTVELLGPAVIDFEHHFTLGLVNRKAPGLTFDVVSSLLYVDRRGAPENQQLGFDTTAKAVMLRAIAEGGRNCSERCWITEVNWPLWEGPHSPAGREVSVDESTQADYLVRYYILVLATGLIERVFWWRLIARGYGLCDPEADGSLRRRPSHRALAVLASTLDGTTCTGPLKLGHGIHAFLFEREADTVLVGWTVTGKVDVDLPGSPFECFDRDGNPHELHGDARATLSSSPQYFRLPRTACAHKP